jgi:DNA-binding HxlR family transcriptional regulator
VQPKKSLTSTLRGLERSVLVRSIIAQVPIRVEDEVPALGHELIVKFQPLKVGGTAARRALTRHTGVRLHRGPLSAGDIKPNRS